MCLVLFIILTSCLHLSSIAYEHSHVYAADIISLLDSEGDTYLDDYLYQKDDIKTQMI
jgi:hypothetical protein